MRGFREAVSRLLDLLAPPGCPACDGACPPTRSFCSACGAPVSASGGLVLEGVPLLVVGNYEPPLSTAIRRFKYAGRPELARPLSNLLLPVLDELDRADPLTLVPVPLHPRRLASRGYNQAALLASELGNKAGLACRPRLLKRTRAMDHQVGKSRSERVENVAGAFELRQLTEARVVLVDDVITTGSTVRACAHALAAGRVRLAAVVALARAERGGSGAWQTSAAQAG
jgi:ComF family protein